MKQLFSEESILVRFMSKVGCLIALSFFWLICSIPLVTIGASSAALFRSVFDLREDKDHILKGFFKAFAASFKLGTLCWLLVAAAFAVVYCIPRMLVLFPNNIIITVGVALTSALMLILWLLLVCLFPMVAYFDNSVQKTMRNAMFVAIKHRGPSVSSAFLAAVPLILLLVAPQIFLVSSGVWCLIYPGVLAYYMVCRFAPIFLEYGNKRKERLEQGEE